jgi:hypothetical protein
MANVWLLRHGDEKQQAQALAALAAISGIGEAQ